MAPNKISVPEFGKIRQLIWPIHNFELKKLIPMFTLCFLIAFVYNVLHCLKVPLIVKAEGSSAEVIPFLQIVAILPVAVLLTYIYTKLMSHYSRERVFYIITAGFLTYFACFLVFLYPNQQALQLDTIADFLQNHIFTGSGTKGLIAAIRHLNLTLFYVLAEMWSVMVLFMLFWGFANEVTKVEEAKRFYAIFALGGNFSGIVSGMFARSVDSITDIPVLPGYVGNEWLFLQLSTILLAGLVVIYLYWWLNRNVFPAANTKNVEYKVKRTQISLTECFSYLRTSRYVTYMVLIVVGYYIVYNLADIMWAYKIQLVMETGKDINSYMSQVYSLTGIVSVVLALLVSGNVIRKYGWTIAALVTPFVWLLTSLGFFSSIALEGTMVFDVIGNIVSNPTNLILMIGSLQIIFGRGCKYTLFDETKEIAFIPLSKDEQRKCKVIVDGLASRFGKSGGSVIYVILLFIFGDMANIVPYVAGIILIALIGWIYATIQMGKIIAEAAEENTLHITETKVGAEPLRVLQPEEAQA